MAGPDDLTHEATEKYRFKATGPSEGLSVFGLSGFYTFANDLNYGVNAQGNRTGVYGECLRSNQETNRESDVEGTGVYGYGDGFGIYGNGNLGLAGVLGTNNKGRVGVIGATMDETFQGTVIRSGTGIFGASFSSLGNPLVTFQSIPPLAVPILLGSGTGVFGLSGKGKGVYGTSIEGIGGEFKSDNEKGVYGHSTNGIGGEFESDNEKGVYGHSKSGIGGEFKSSINIGVRGSSFDSRGGEFECASGAKAQLRLVPALRAEFPRLPKEGRVGDIILLRHTYFDGETDRDYCVLWLCVPNNNKFPSGSDESDLWQEIRLGQTALGDL